MTPLRPIPPLPDLATLPRAELEALVRTLHGGLAGSAETLNRLSTMMQRSEDSMRSLRDRVLMLEARSLPNGGDAP